nr:MAG TPA: hypothetical protein [Caudoviricetes sp.]
MHSYDFMISSPSYFRYSLYTLIERGIRERVYS